MAGTRRPARYAHADGHTDVIYADNKILTCGSDGDIRVWVDLEDDDPHNVCVGEWALSIAYHGERIYVSTDNNAIQTYTYPGFEKDGIVTRFTAPITHIASSNKLPGLICSSENMECRICTYDGSKWAVNTITHQGPVLGVAICPLAKHCVTSCGDGMYRIWKVDDSSMVTEISAIPKVNSFYSAKVLGRVSFEPISGKLLAYPSNKEIIVLDAKNWQKKFSLTNPLIKSPLSICLFSPCGNYLAASTTVGQIIIWNINEQKFLSSTEHPSVLNICSMSWNPSGNGELAFCDVSGQLATVIDCYSDETDAPDDENLDLIDIIEREKENGDDISEFQVETDADDDDENTISLRKLKNETMGADGHLSTGARSRSQSRSRSPSPDKYIPPALATAQVPFQPSATPIHLEHRYMCWNDVGIVRCHTIGDNSSIEVEFHDSSVHHSIHLNNHLNHTLASLSSTVLALACEAPSKIVCITLVGGSKEWSVPMGDLEEILCISATDMLVAIATSNRFLRLYTTLGTQLHVISLLGSPICLAGRDNIIHVYYHGANPGTHDQHISMDIINTKGTDVNCRRMGVHVALSRVSLLRWCGATARGLPVTLDSAGMVRLYDVKSNLWIPICDTSSHYKGVSDAYFIISINEEKQCIIAVLCRGASFPPTAPRPIATQLPLKLPLCEIETEKGQHEEQLRRTSLLPSENEPRIRTEIVLKLFALACKSDIEQRASEIVELLHDQQIAALATKYASRLGKLHLAEKISNLVDSWTENEPEPESIFENEIPSSQITEIEETETEDLNASLIIQKTKKQADVVEVKPLPLPRFSQGGGKNPFRRSIISDSNKKSPLALTDRSLVNNQVDSPARTKLSILNPNEGESFVQWYERNKEALLAEHENLTPSEISQTAVRKYKSLKAEVKNDSASKRKLSPERSNETNENVIPTSTPKQSKLSGFAFQKRN